MQEPDLSVTLSEDGKTLRIYGVNSTAEARELRFHLLDFPAALKGGTALVLKDREAAGTPEVMNSRDDPERIAPVAGPINAAGSGLRLFLRALHRDFARIRPGRVKLRRQSFPLPNMCRGVPLRIDIIRDEPRTRD